MKMITHYPGGKPIPTSRKLDADTVIGVIAVALLCFGIWLVCATPEISLVVGFTAR